MNQDRLERKMIFYFLITNSNIFCVIRELNDSIIYTIFSGLCFVMAIMVLIQNRFHKKITRNGVKKWESD